MAKDLTTENKTEIRLRNLKKIGIDKPAIQPTPEQKKAGWERKRQRQAMADKIMQFKNLKYTDVLEIRSILKKDYKTAKDFETLAKILNVEYVSLEDVHLFTYAFSEKFILDWIDRNLEKAPIRTELTGNDGKDLIPNAIDLSKLSDKELKDLDSLVTKASKL